MGKCTYLRLSDLINLAIDLVGAYISSRSLLFTGAQVRCAVWMLGTQLQRKRSRNDLQWTKSQYVLSEMSEIEMFFFILQLFSTWILLWFILLSVSDIILQTMVFLVSWIFELKSFEFFFPSNLPFFHIFADDMLIILHGLHGRKCVYTVYFPFQVECDHDFDVLFWKWLLVQTKI